MHQRSERIFSNTLFAAGRRAGLLALLDVPRDHDALLGSMVLGFTSSFVQDDANMPAGLDF
jgi:hypothetical protein